MQALGEPAHALLQSRQSEEHKRKAGERGSRGRYTSAAQQFDQRPDAALARRRPAGCKGTSGLEGCVPVLAQTPQDRRVEIPECRGLDSIGEHAHEEPSRKMGGSDPAQMVPPLEAKLI